MILSLVARFPIRTRDGGGIGLEAVFTRLRSERPSLAATKERLMESRS